MGACFYASISLSAVYLNCMLLLVQILLRRTTSKSTPRAWKLTTFLYSITDRTFKGIRCSFGDHRWKRNVIRMSIQACPPAYEEADCMISIRIGLFPSFPEPR